MKLRNKRTGEITDLSKNGFLKSDNDDHIVVYQEGTLKYYAYNSIAELNEEWEVYSPTEPLIKDEKIRKAVRAWAEANGIGGCVCKEEIHCITFETERGMFISFENADPIPPEGNFTITELCGEEEE